MNWLLLGAVTAAERGEWWPDSSVGRLWVAFGLVAQAAFTGRFLVQWVASERRKESYVPIAFWYLSLLGGAMLLTYAVFWKQDPVLTAGQSVGCVVYIRNLVLLKRTGAAASTNGD